MEHGRNEWPTFNQTYTLHLFQASSLSTRTDGSISYLFFTFPGRDDHSVAVDDGYLDKFDNLPARPPVR